MFSSVWKYPRNTLDIFLEIKFPYCGRGPVFWFVCLFVCLFVFPVYCQNKVTLTWEKLSLFLAERDTHLAWHVFCWPKNQERKGVILFSFKYIIKASINNYTFTEIINFILQSQRSCAATSASAKISYELRTLSIIFYISYLRLFSVGSNNQNKLNQNQALEKFENILKIL